MALSGKKKVMLSYNWNSQEIVEKVYDMLNGAEGILPWMDIKGGMQDNIYISMAEGVETAEVVCCFMTSDYQKSANCQLELQYAKIRRKHIIPCMLGDQAWKPTSWLGLITAGLLYIDFRDNSEEKFRSQTAELIKKINEQTSVPTEPPKEEPSYLFELIRYQYLRNNRIERIMDPSKSFPIEQSYINLAIVETKEQQEKEKKLRDTQHSDAIIGTFEEIYGTKTSINVKDILEKCKDKPEQVIVFGRAGIGKSTFCRYAANQWANGVIWSKYKLVVLLPLRNLTEDRYPILPPGSRYAPIDFVQKQYLSDYELSVKDTQLLTAQFFKTDVLWFLDGYDELPLHMKDSIEQLRKSTHHIVTSRPYMNTLSYDVQMEITGFTDDNIAEYVKQFFDQIEGTLKDASSEGQKLLSFLKLNPSIWGVAHIPVNLELICSLWGDTDWSEIKTLTITSLYDKMAEWLCRRYLTGQDPKNKNLIKEEVYEVCKKELTFLETLAYLGMENKSIILKPDLLRKAEKESNWSLMKHPELLNIGILKALNNKATGSFNDREKDHYFVHLSFQEYFAARYLVTRLTGSAPEGAIEFIKTKKYNRRFTLMLSFASGLLIQTDNVTCIDTFWDAIQGEPLDQVGIRHMQIVTSCMEETANNKSFTRRNDLINFIIKCTECAVHAEHKIIRDYLIDTLRRSPTIVNEDKLMETFTILLQTNNETTKENAISFISKLPIINPHKFIQTLLTTLRDANDYVREGACVTLGQIGEKAATKDVFEALVITLGDAIDNVRWAASEALVKMGQKAETKDVIEALVRAVGDANDDARCAASQALGEMCEKAATKDVIVALLRALGDAEENVRSAACNALGTMGQKAATKDVIEALVRALVDANENVRWAACDALGTMGENAATKDVIEALVRALVDADDDVRWAACKALGQIGEKTATKDVIEALVRALGDAEENVRSAACFALAKMGEKAATNDVIEALVRALGDAKEDVRWAACDALGEIAEKAATKDVIEALVTALGNAKSYVREEACNALGKMGEKAATKDVIEALVRTLGIADYDIQRVASNALGEMGQKAETKDVIEALVRALGDANDNVRRMACNALAKMGQKAATKDVIEALVRALVDANEYVRRAACDALAKMGEKAATKDVIEALVRALGDAKEDVRWAACDALGEIAEKAATKDVIEALVRALGDANHNVRRIACDALGEIAEKAATKDVIEALVRALVDANEYVRRAACDALAKMDEKAATKDVIEALVRALGDAKNDVRWAACKALGQIGEKTATKDVIEALVRALGDAKEDVRWAACKALGQMGEKAATKDVIEALVRTLGDANDKVRWATYEALGQIGEKAATKDVIEELVRALGDANDKVREGACKALSQMGEKAATSIVITGLLCTASKWDASESLVEILRSSPSLSYMDSNTVSKLIQWWNGHVESCREILLEKMIKAYLDTKIAEWCPIIAVHSLNTGCAVTFAEQTIIVYDKYEPVPIGKASSTVCDELARAFTNQRDGFYRYNVTSE